MQCWAVRMRLIDPIAVECVFWAEDDGWKGVCEDLSILVRGRDFEESKKQMETVLKTYVRSLFREDSAARLSSDFEMGSLVTAGRDLGARVP